MAAADTGKLIVRGAREHNLRNVSVELPRDKMIVFTGLSGSGKSSLAFDTIYAEGQRRYVESLSAYARQFLGQMDKPDVDFIEGLSPAVSIDQKSTSKNPRSTVGTITEFSAGITPGAFPVSIAAGPDGNLWFTENLAGKLGKITPAGAVTELACIPTANSGPTNITVGPDGRLWLTETGANKIARVQIP